MLEKEWEGQLRSYIGCREFGRPFIAWYPENGYYLTDKFEKFSDKKHLVNIRIGDNDKMFMGALQKIKVHHVDYDNRVLMHLHYTGDDVEELMYESKRLAFEYLEYFSRPKVYMSFYHPIKIKEFEQVFVL